MSLLLDDQTVRRVLDPLILVDAIELAIMAEARSASVLPDRMNLAGEGRFLRVMPAIVPNARVMGLKTFFGGGGIPVRYVVLLMSTVSGEVLASMDACYLTAARTAATSAVAARSLGVTAPTIGVLGSGLEAEAHVRTFAALGGVQEFRVFSPNPVSRERFAERMHSELALTGVRVTAVDSAREACTGVEHLITATNTGYGGPIACESEWVPSGIHLTAIGSTHEDLRELETAILRRASVLVFDADANAIAEESGDVKAFIQEGGNLGGVVQLDAVVQGAYSVPAGHKDLTIFKSVGTALQDMVAADLAFRMAEIQGLGSKWDALAAPKVRA